MEVLNSKDRQDSRPLYKAYRDRGLGFGDKKGDPMGGSFGGGCAGLLSNTKKCPTWGHLSLVHMSDPNLFFL
jgi:hypothetical protein